MASEPSAAAAKKKKSQQHRKPSAIKRARQNRKRCLHNHQQTSALHTAIKKVRISIKNGNKTDAQKVLSDVLPLLSKAGQKWLVHPRKASRLTGLLSAQVSALK